MNYTQNEKIAQVTEKTLIIGIDIGSESHYARAFNWRGQELGKKVFHFNDDMLANVKVNFTSVKNSLPCGGKIILPPTSRGRPQALIALEKSKENVLERDGFRPVQFKLNRN